MQPKEVDDDFDALLSGLPKNTEAEQALLGALLFDNQAYEDVASFLNPEHFALPVHGRIYDAIRHRIDHGQEASPITLKPYFDDDEALKDVSGATYLIQLAGEAVSVISVADYGREIEDLAIKRDLFRVGRDMTQEVCKPEIEVSGRDQLEQFEAELYKLADHGQNDVVSFLQAAEVAVEDIERARQSGSHLTGITTGLTALNKATGGFHPGELVIIAGSTSMGKTSLAVDIATRAAQRYMRDLADGADPTENGGASVAFFSLEMSSNELAKRILSSGAKVNLEKLRNGQISAQETLRVARAAEENAKLPLYIDDTASMTISGLRARARRLIRKNDVGLIVVDYLQLLEGTNRRQSETRTQEVSEITRGLKLLAKDLHVPVIGLSQLSRAPSHRENKRPRLADLRESGSIEQDADMVLFVYREEYHHQANKPDSGSADYNEWLDKLDQLRGKAEVIIGKQRHGATGTEEVFFESEITSFSDLARDLMDG
ncbi:replicative DNA helicase [Pelagibius sp. Alg239-R121]|uniref:replicative DNA helicase n=1 Tax=Pelagibius sp. Alg239-R121 TaxID=2993448 RepID=UPI0024A6A613|nr:replicative DNA helicase [Pelagibius sp. Alg239-R121]